MDAALALPIIAVVLGLCIPLLAIWTQHKKEMALIEKGLYQPDKTDKQGPRGQAALLWGLILTLVGMAVVIGSLMMYRSLLLPGLVVEAVGIALLIYSLIVKRQLPPQ